VYEVQGPQGPIGPEADTSTLQSLIDALDQRVTALESSIPPTPLSSFEFENNVLDSTGTNHGTVTGIEKYTTGKIGNAAFDFDGLSYITLANESNFDFEHNQPFSFSFWIQVSTFGVDLAVSKTDDIVSRGNSGYGIYTTTSSGGGVVGRLTTTNERVDSGPVIAFGTNVWTHIVMTYEGNSNANGIKMYKDGVLQTTGSDISLTETMLNNDVFSIGVESDGGRKLSVNTFLDNVKIFDFELTPTQVSDVFNES